MNVDPSYVVVGNSPLSLRESMLAEAYRMGEDVVRVSQEICPPKGLFGAFCIETIITPDAQFYIMEDLGAHRRRHEPRSSTARPTRT